MNIEYEKDAAKHINQINLHIETGEQKKQSENCLMTTLSIPISLNIHSVQI